MIVLYALSWSAVFFLLALWSLGAWACHAVATWTLANAGDLAGGSVVIADARVPDWVALWVPPELMLAWTSTLAAMTPAIDSALAQVPALAGGLSTVIWLGWGLGAALLVFAGLAGHWLITMLRNRGPGFSLPR